MEGYEVVTMEDAAPIGDIFCYSNRQYHCSLPASTFEQMKDEAIVCNIGHFDNEIDMAYLERTPG